MRLVNDKVFKAVFVTESTKEILAYLLNAILGYTDNRKIAANCLNCDYYD